MPNKVLNSRLKLKVDTLENWESSEVILLAGEVAFATIETASGNITNVPTVVMKVGDGTHKWSELKYVYAQASDVYAWAKKAQPDYNDLINKPSIPTVPVYTLEPGTTAGTLKLLKNGAGSEVKVAGWDALNTLVNEKADADHTHTSEDITDFDTAVNALIAAGNFAVKGQIKDADIAADAAIAVSKISGLGALATKNTVAEADISGTIAHTKISGLGTAAMADTTDFATAAQGAKADAAMPAAGGEFSGPVTVQAPTADMNPAPKKYVDDAVSAAASGSFKVVDDLPDTGDPGVIYLVAHEHGEGDVYDEYIYTNGAWEKIGNTDIDLSDYVTNDEIADMATKTWVGQQSFATTSTVNGINSRLTTAEGEIDALQSGKADAEHTHEIADVTGLQSALDGKQAANANLTAIAGLAATAGFVKRTASGFEIDSNDYQTQTEVESQITAHAGVDKVGTVTSVATGAGLKVTGTASVNPTIGFDDEYTFVIDCGSSTVNVDPVS